MYKVSVIVPIYNVEKYIERCFNSIANQTYKNIECIFIDDATTDSSVTVCCDLISRYQGPIDFKILHHSKNRGLSAARNTGIECASGEFVFFLDSDDELTEDCISLLTTRVMKDDNLEMVTASVESVPYDSYYYYPCYKDGITINNNTEFRYQLFRQNNNFPITAWNKLVKTSFLKTNHLFFKESLVNEDELWTFQISRIIEHVAVISQTTYIHYSTEKSIMTSTNLEKRASNVLYILNMILPRIDSPLSTLQQLFYLKYLIKWYKYSTKSVYLPLSIKFSRIACKSRKWKLAIYVCSFFLLIHHENTWERKLYQYIDKIYQEEERKIIQTL